MKKGNNNTGKLKAYSKDGQMQAAPGYKHTLTPKKGESATKTLKVGTTSKEVPNGAYIPKPTTVAKAPAPKKSSLKAPSARQTGMKMQMRKGGKGGKC